MAWGFANPLDTGGLIIWVWVYFNFFNFQFWCVVGFGLVAGRVGMRQGGLWVGWLVGRDAMHCVSTKITTKTITTIAMAAKRGEISNTINIGGNIICVLIHLKNLSLSQFAGLLMM